MTWEGLSPPYSTIVADPPWAYEDGWPEWASRGGQPRVRKALSYSSMSVEEIQALPVADLAAAYAHLYLWTTNRYLWAARDVVAAWGFVPVEVVVWCKEPVGVGPGGMFSVTTEFVIVAKRGRRQIEQLGRIIREARESAGLSRVELHKQVRGDKPTGLVNRWEEGNCSPTEADWRRLQATLPTLAGAPRPDGTRARVPSNWFRWPRGQHSAKPPAFLDLVEQVSHGPYVELFARQPRLGWDSWGHGYEVAS